MTDLALSFEAWKTRRLAALAAPDGWLNIIGRYPLDVGEVSVGRSPDNDIVLPAGPDHVGRLRQDEAGSVSYLPADGGPRRVLPLDKRAPPRFAAGTLLLEVTTLNGEQALRVRDTASEAPGRLAPIRYFPFDPKWRVTADWIALDAPRRLTVETSKAIRTEVEATHKAAFALDGRRLELVATHGTAEAPQFVFRDLTARDSTYPAARFLFGEEVTDRTVVLDFNRAINPPCAFTDFAVCPLPPPENILPLRVEAGEKAPVR